MASGHERLEALWEADPAAAIKLLKTLAPLVVKPHEGQQEVLNNPARFKVLNAGRRWGKTKIGVKSMLTAARKKDQLVWWVAPTYKVVKRGYRETLRQIPRSMLTQDPPPETNFDAGRSVILKLTNGTTIEFYSAERPGGMLGEGVNYVVLDEAATMPSTVWEQIIRPTLADTKGGALLISTPRGRNWFYDRWLFGQDAQEAEWSSWTFPSASNPYLDPSEIDALKRELTTLLFDQEVLAKFLAAGSTVFQWDQKSVQSERILENGLVEDVKVEGHQFLGIDLAKTSDYTVLYGANSANLRNTYFERLNTVSWAEQKRRIARAARTLKRNGATGITLVMDSTGVGDPIVEAMENQGFDVIGINFTTFKNKMVTLFANDLEEGKAFILEEGQKSEFENYAMDQTKAGRITYSAPEGQHDDAVSAKILQHWGIINEGAPDANLLSAEDLDSDPSNTYDEDAEPWDDLLDDEGDDFVASDTDRWTQQALEVLTAPQAAVARRPTPEEIFAHEDSLRPHR